MNNIPQTKDSKAVTNTPFYSSALREIIIISRYIDREMFFYNFKLNY
jgi:hypothetical protein